MHQFSILTNRQVRRVALVWSLCALLTACSNSQSTKVQERVNYWRGLLEDGVPPGTSLSDAQKWLTRRQVKVHFLEEQRWIYGNVESVPDQSVIHFPCSGWNIIIAIP